MFRIVPEDREKEIRRKIPAGKHYIAYAGQFRGKRIWTLTCTARRERAGVGKLLNLISPIIHFSQIEFAKQNRFRKEER